MNPGRELDALVAEKVMGIDLTKPGETPGSIFPPGYWNDFHKAMGSPRLNAKPYSTDISAAWEVVEKMRENKLFSFFVGLHNEFEKLGFTNAHEEFTVNVTDGVPHAICLAALKAVGL